MEKIAGGQSPVCGVICESAAVRVQRHLSQECRVLSDAAPARIALDSGVDSDFLGSARRERKRRNFHIGASALVDARNRRLYRQCGEPFDPDAAV